MEKIRHQLIIGTTAEQVYHAITTPHGLSNWWAPHTTTDTEPGGIARIPFGNGYFKEMVLVTLDPFSQVVWNCVAGDDQWIGTTITFNLQERIRHTILKDHPELSGQAEQNESEYVTVVTFEHLGWKAATSMHAECSYTWALFLRSLKLFCETGRGTPWPHQHRTAIEG